MEGQPLDVPAEMLEAFLEETAGLHKPDDVTRIEARFEHVVPAPRAVATAGDAKWDFAGTDDAHKLVLVMTPAIRAAWRKAGRLDLHVGVVRAVPLASLSAPPDKLDIPEDATFVVHQRHEQPVPGSRRWLLLQLGDITRGQVRTTLTAGSEDVFRRISVRRGESVHFRLGTTHYRLTLTRIQKHLIADDWARWTVSEMTPKEAAEMYDARARIAALLKGMETWPLEFERDGVARTAKEEAQFYRDVCPAEAPRIVSTEGFIREVLARATRHGDYRVKTPGGAVLDARQWLRTQLAAPPPLPPDHI
jgi:hypothetical protein